MTLYGSMVVLLHFYGNRGCVRESENERGRCVCFICRWQGSGFVLRTAMIT